MCRVTRGRRRYFGRLLQGRLLLNGSSLFLAVLSLTPIVHDACGVALGQAGSFGLTVGVAVLATCVLAIANLRGRLEY